MQKKKEEYEKTTYASKTKKYYNEKSDEYVISKFDREFGQV